MIKWTVDKIRQTWLDFWKSKDHLVLPSKSLIPEDDPTLLWINSGVATLKKYFSGLQNPPSKRLTNSQKAIRTNDIENIGVTSRHHSFFEMLGNFSIGDYFKKEVINWAYELLVDVYKLDPRRIYITVYEKDDEAYNLWSRLIDKTHIIKCNKDRNFWDIGAGPCGPCTEIYYDRGPKFDFAKKGIRLFYEDIENDRYVEIWNIVFSQFDNDGKGNYSELARKNIDTGAGLERLACVLQNTPTNFEIDTFIKVINVLQTLSPLKYNQNAYFTNNKKQSAINSAYKIIVDHLRACCFAIADGVVPSNKENGYVLRKLIRRVMIYAKKLEISENFIEVVTKKIISVMSGYYDYLLSKQKQIIEILQYEENLFNKTISNGFELFNKIVTSKKQTIPADQVFKLLDTYGFPLEIILELAQKSNLKIDLKAVNTLIEQHKKKSSTILPQHNKVWAQQNADLLAFKEPSVFLYDSLTTQAKIVGIFDAKFKQIKTIKAPGKYWLVFDKTTIYALAGGQAADQGTIKINETIFKVDDCIQGPNHQHFHCITNNSNVVINLGDKASIATDPNVRMILARHHTCIHLLHSALNRLISKEINQDGTSKTIHKATFDFHYHKHLTDKELQQVEDQVNQWIKHGENVIIEQLTLKEAKSKHALANFDDVYAKISGKLNVVEIGNISCEVCCGTHIKNIHDLQQMHIIKLLAKGSGNWRLEIIAGDNLTLQYIETENKTVQSQVKQMQNFLANVDKNTKDSVIKDIKKFVDDYQPAKSWTEIKQQKQKLVSLLPSFQLAQRQAQKSNLNNQIQKVIDNFKLQDDKIYQFIDVGNLDPSLLIALAQKIVNVYKDKIFLILTHRQNKLFFIFAKNKKTMSGKADDCKQILKEFTTIIEAKGGGSDVFVQGSANCQPNDLKKIKTWFAKKN